MKRIEWPPGSGRVADYEPHEVEIIRGLTERCERGEISQQQLGHELGILHDLKVELDARVIEPTATVPGPKSETGLPVPAQLRIDEPQLRIDDVGGGGHVGNGGPSYGGHGGDGGDGGDDEGDVLPPYEGPDMTVAEARVLLNKHLKDGMECPCCLQLARIWRRKLTSVPARALIALWRTDPDQGWTHLPTVASRLLPDVSHQGGYISLGGYWGLMEEERLIRRDDGGRAGFWRLTELGKRWVFNETRVPMYAYIYDRRLLGLGGDHVSVVDALGTHFDYRELMGR